VVNPMLLLTAQEMELVELRVASRPAAAVTPSEPAMPSNLTNDCSLPPLPPREEEALAILSALPLDVLVLRWVNHHLLDGNKVGGLDTIDAAEMRDLADRLDASETARKDVRRWWRRQEEPIDSRAPAVATSIYKMPVEAGEALEVPPAFDPITLNASVSDATLRILKEELGKRVAMDVDDDHALSSQVELPSELEDVLSPLGDQSEFSRQRRELSLQAASAVSSGIAGLVATSLEAASGDAASGVSRRQGFSSMSSLSAARHRSEGGGKPPRASRSDSRGSKGKAGRDSRTSVPREVVHDPAAVHSLQHLLTGPDMRRTVLENFATEVADGTALALLSHRLTASRHRYQRRLVTAVFAPASRSGGCENGRTRPVAPSLVWEAMTALAPAASEETTEEGERQRNDAARRAQLSLMNSEELAESSFALRTERMRSHQGSARMEASTQRRMERRRFRQARKLRMRGLLVTPSSGADDDSAGVQLSGAASLNNAEVFSDTSDSSALTVELEDLNSSGSEDIDDAAERVFFSSMTSAHQQGSLSAVLPPPESDSEIITSDSDDEFVSEKGLPRTWARRMERAKRADAVMSKCLQVLEQGGRGEHSALLRHTTPLPRAEEAVTRLGQLGVPEGILTPEQLLSCAADPVTGQLPESITGPGLTVHAPCAPWQGSVFTLASCAYLFCAHPELRAAQAYTPDSDRSSAVQMYDHDRVLRPVLVSQSQVPPKESPAESLDVTSEEDVSLPPTPRRSTRGRKKKTAPPMPMATEAPARVEQSGNMEVQPHPLLQVRAGGTPMLSSSAADSDDVLALGVRAPASHSDMMRRIRSVLSIGADSMLAHPLTLSRVIRVAAQLRDEWKSLVRLATIGSPHMNPAAVTAGVEAVSLLEEIVSRARQQRHAAWNMWIRLREHLQAGVWSLLRRVSSGQRITIADRKAQRLRQSFVQDPLTKESLTGIVKEAFRSQSCVRHVATLARGHLRRMLMAKGVSIPGQRRRRGEDADAVESDDEASQRVQGMTIRQLQAALSLAGRARIGEVLTEVAAGEVLSTPSATDVMVSLDPSASVALQRLRTATSFSRAVVGLQSSPSFRRGGASSDLASPNELAMPYAHSPTVESAANRFAALAPLESTAERIGSVLRTFYLDLRRVFEHYAASARAGSAARLDVGEFLELLSDSRMLSAEEGDAEEWLRQDVTRLDGIGRSSSRRPGGGAGMGARSVLVTRDGKSTLLDTGPGGEPSDRNPIPTISGGLTRSEARVAFLTGSARDTAKIVAAASLSSADGRLVDSRAELRPQEFVVALLRAAVWFCARERAALAVRAASTSSASILHAGDSSLVASRFHRASARIRAWGRMPAEALSASPSSKPPPGDSSRSARALDPFGASFPPPSGAPNFELLVQGPMPPMSETLWQATVDPAIALTVVLRMFVLRNSAKPPPSELAAHLRMPSVKHVLSRHRKALQAIYSMFVAARRHADAEAAAKSKDGAADREERSSNQRACITVEDLVELLRVDTSILMPITGVAASTSLAAATGKPVHRQLTGNELAWIVCKVKAAPIAVSNSIALGGSMDETAMIALASIAQVPGFRSSVEQFLGGASEEKTLESVKKGPRLIAAASFREAPVSLTLGDSREDASIVGEISAAVVGEAMENAHVAAKKVATTVILGGPHEDASTAAWQRRKHKAVEWLPDSALDRRSGPKKLVVEVKYDAPRPNGAPSVPSTASQSLLKVLLGKEDRAAIRLATRKQFVRTGEAREELVQELVLLDPVNPMISAEASSTVAAVVGMTSRRPSVVPVVAAVTDAAALTVLGGLGYTQLPTAAATASARTKPSVPTSAPSVSDLIPHVARSMVVDLSTELTFSEFSLLLCAVALELHPDPYEDTAALLDRFLCERVLPCFHFSTSS
jgi:hypothetical protein